MHSILSILQFSSTNQMNKMQSVIHVTRTIQCNFNIFELLGFKGWSNGLQTKRFWVLVTPFTPYSYFFSNLSNDVRGEQQAFSIVSSRSFIFNSCLDVRVLKCTCKTFSGLDTTFKQDKNESPHAITQQLKITNAEAFALTKCGRPPVLHTLDAMCGFALWEFNRRYQGTSLFYFHQDILFRLDLCAQKEHLELILLNLSCVHVPMNAINTVVYIGFCCHGKIYCPTVRRVARPLRSKRAFPNNTVRQAIDQARFGFLFVESFH